MVALVPHMQLQNKNVKNTYISKTIKTIKIKNCFSHLHHQNPPLMGATCQDLHGSQTHYMANPLPQSTDTSTMQRKWACMTYVGPLQSWASVHSIGPSVDLMALGDLPMSVDSGTMGSVPSIKPPEWNDIQIASDFLPCI